MTDTFRDRLFAAADKIDIGGGITEPMISVGYALTIFDLILQVVETEIIRERNSVKKIYTVSAPYNKCIEILRRHMGEN